MANEVKLTAAQTAALKKAQAKQEAQYKLFRENPDKLAAEIAVQIRADNHAGEDPEEYDNGTMHWYQQAWGNVKARAGSFVKLTKPVIPYYSDGPLAPEDHSYFEVTCPTTGCIAGWADSLAGFNLVFKKNIGWDDRDYYAQNYPKFSDEEIVLDQYVEGEVINVEHCYDPVMQKVRDIEEVAYELLDLTGDQKAWLFHGDRSKDEVLWALDKIAAGDKEWDGDYCDVLEDEAEDVEIDA